jgi:putative DNA primase/helicase
MPNLIATGTEPAVRPHTDESEEVRKVLYSALLAGDSALLFDNAPNGVKIRSAVLCGFTTAATYADRRLGTSDSRGLPNRIVVTITGNNITPCGDLARRSLVCRLDVNAESARGRQFRISDLASHVTRHRSAMLAATLTIVRGYIAAGCPRVAPPLESFEAWSRLCRDPLIWLGMADAVESQVTETDDEVDSLRAAFTALTSVFDGREFMARDVCAAMGSSAMELRAALSAAGCSDADDAAKIGYWLRANRDKVTAGQKLIARPSRDGISKWRLRGA